MPKYILGARGHDYGKGRVKDIFSLMHQDGWTCTQLAFKKLVDGVKSYEDVTPELIKEVEAAMREVPMDVAVLGTYVEIFRRIYKKLRAVILTKVSTAALFYS